MKSPMVERGAAEGWLSKKSGYTDLQVCQSGAGYYVGTMFNECDAHGKFLYQEPGSRDSDYFATKEEAETFLKELIAGERDPSELRQRP